MFFKGIISREYRLPTLSDFFAACEVTSRIFFIGTVNNINITFLFVKNPISDSNLFITRIMNLSTVLYPSKWTIQKVISLRRIRNLRQVLHQGLNSSTARAPTNLNLIKGKESVPGSKTNQRLSLRYSLVAFNRNNSLWKRNMQRIWRNFSSIYWNPCGLSL